MKSSYSYSIVVLALVLIFVLGECPTARADSYATADLILSGSDYVASGSTGNGWTDLMGGETYTSWRGWVEYEVYLTAGEWTFGLEAINRGYLGSDWYSHFKVQDSITGQTMKIVASDDVAHIGQQTADIFSDGLYTIRFSWLNDQWGPNFRPVRDANIQINTVFFDKAGSSASAPEPASGLLLASAVGLVAWVRRRRSSDCVQSICNF